MPFKLKYNKSSFPYKGESHDFVHHGDYKIVREDLEEGVLGEAENGKIIPEHNKELVRYILKKRKK